MVPLRSNKRSLDVIERNIRFYKMRDHKLATLWSHNLIKGLWCNKRKMVKQNRFFFAMFHSQIWSLDATYCTCRFVTLDHHKNEMQNQKQNEQNEQNRTKHVQLHNLIYTTNKSSLYTQLHFDLNYKLMNDTSYLQATLTHTQMILVH